MSTLPTHMRALIQTAYGPPSKSLSLHNIPLPSFSPSSADLLVQVKCASIAPVEYGFLMGYARLLGVFHIPDGLGIDFSGVVVQVGEGADTQGWKEGDEVMGVLPMSRKGVYQEYVLVPAHCVARKPGNLTWEEASTLPANGITAVQAIKKHKGGREAAFVTGGLGGVGHLAVQLLHHKFGFERVITSVSTGKIEQIKALYPYCEVVDYKTSNPAKSLPPQSVDLVFSTLGSPGQFTPLLARSRPTPTLIEIATSPGSAVVSANWDIPFPWYTRWLFDGMAWALRPRLPRGVQWVPHSTALIKEDLEEVAKQAEAGRLKPLVGKVFTLERAAEGFELAHKGIVGRVIINVAE